MADAREFQAWNLVRVQSLLNQLDLALTFCSVARKTRFQTADFGRAVQNAGKVYDLATTQMFRLALDHSQFNLLMANAERLRFLLKDLGWDPQSRPGP
jgi:hypothetical protein